MIMTVTTKVILGITAAAVAGAVLGMLIAPEKGVAIQGKIKESAAEWLQDIAAMLVTGKEAATKFNVQAHTNLDEAASKLVALAAKDRSAENY
jgi:gas vesicle protein